MSSTIILSSCGNKQTPEEQAKNFGKYFLEKINSGSLDSIQTYYPGIMKADSIKPIHSDTILVARSTIPAQYVITLMDGVTINVTQEEAGNFRVVDSKGLFAFPEYKVELAKKTGMWDDNLTDEVMNEKMNDNDFFQYIADKQGACISKIITWGKRGTVTKVPKDGLDSGKGYFIFTNKSNQAIKGSDYNVIENEINERFGSSNSTHKGVDIPANGSAHYNVTFSGHTIDLQIKDIKWNIPEAELISRYAVLTGKEYQEYLMSKK